MTRGAMPLDGVRVLDVSTEIAGPYATRLLADSGADVVKIEAPGGDPMRGFRTPHMLTHGEPLPPGKTGPLFHFLNTSKRSATLDLEQSGDRDLFQGLAAGADLIVESFAPGSLEEQGLGFEALSRENPRLSLVSISPFGQDGPWRDRPATEFTLQAETGSLAFRGYPDRPPVATGGRIGEFTSGIFAAVALRIPVAPVGDGRSVLEADHYRDRGVFVRNPAGFLQPRVPLSGARSGRWRSFRRS